MTQFLIDTDTASDDAVALIMALRSPAVEVLGITTVAGNVEVEQATRNALYVVALCGAGTPVYQGSAQPLYRKLQIADWFHGEDGLGDNNYPPARQTAETEHAVSALIRVIRENPGLVLVTFGPLTNIALAIAQAPDIATNVGRCVIMGGAPCCEGNVTPAAEYNMWVDPEAARIVLHSKLPIELVGWHLCRGDAALGLNDIDFVNGIGTKVAKFAIECNSTARDAYLEQTGEHGISLPDPVAMSLALDPSIGISVSRHYVDVETATELTRGMTVVDRLNVATNARNRQTWAALLDRPANALVYWTIDVLRWKKLLYETLAL
jgi:purine nucleosidase